MQVSGAVESNEGKATRLLAGASAMSEKNHDEYYISMNEIEAEFTLGSGPQLPPPVARGAYSPKSAFDRPSAVLRRRNHHGGSARIE